MRFERTPPDDVQEDESEWEIETEDLSDIPDSLIDSDRRRRAAIQVVEEVNADQATTQRELKRTVYPEAAAGYDSPDEWWEKFASRILDEYAEIEQLDSLGLRWRRTE